MKYRTMGTHEVVLLTGCCRQTLIRLADSGRLKFAPRQKVGVDYFGGRPERFWSPEAVKEVVEYTAQNRRRRAKP